jgi:S-adenosyl methyltransferase
VTDVSSPPDEPDAAAGTGIDTTVPHSARIWNYWLGGKDNYAVDREAGDQFSAIYPGIVDIARADRAFLGRVVRYLAGEAGVRQFLDVGTGLPTADLVEPGVVLVDDWRPDPGVGRGPEIPQMGAVGRKK